MKNNQTGFIVPLLIVVVAFLAVVGGGVYFYSQTKSQPAKQEEKTQSASTLQTYRNEKYGFELTFPKTWGKIVVSENKDGIWFKSEQDSGLGSIFYIEALTEQGWKDCQESAKTGIPWCAVNFIAKNSTTIFNYGTGQAYPLSQDERVKEIPEILSTFKFISVNDSHLEKGSETPDTPYIGSIIPWSAKTGTTIEITGSGFLGFESDAYFFFKRADGKIARLSASVSTQNTGDAKGAQTAKVVLKEPCQQGQTVIQDYSGKPIQCDYVQLTPGTYTVYTTPWGNKSNEVQFTIK